MRSGIVKTLIPAAAVCALGFGAVAIAAATSDGAASDGAAKVVAQAPSPPQAPSPRYLFTSARGLDPNKAQRVASTASGSTIGVVGDARARCLVYGNGTDSCATVPDIAQGRSLNVANDCGAPAGPMTISGLVPDGVASVRLTYSDGSARTSPVKSGVAVFDLRTPSGNDPIPVSVEWLNSQAKLMVSREFPIHSASAYCPGG